MAIGVPGRQVALKNAGPLAFPRRTTFCIEEIGPRIARSPKLLDRGGALHLCQRGASIGKSVHARTPKFRHIMGQSRAISTDSLQGLPAIGAGLLLFGQQINVYRLAVPGHWRTGPDRIMVRSAANPAF